MYKEYNPNPLNRRVGDCTIRAISKVTDQNWETTYSAIAIQGLLLCDMPSGNQVWGSYLRSKGFKRYLIPDEYMDTYTVRDFCEEHPKGMFLLALDSHVVAVYDGDYYDTWDSGNEIVIYYWMRKEDE